MLDLIDRALAEDVGNGDLTTEATVPADAAARARIVQKAAGAVAGLDVAGKVFEHVAVDRTSRTAGSDKQRGTLGDLRWTAHVGEGSWGEPGRLVAEVAGPARAILTGERVALNFLGRLSGVATLTARFVRAVEGTGARILDTRKTTPGMRALEKAAVAAAGGTSHRAGLYDAILVKENHSTLAGGVGEATRRALAAAPAGLKVEVECATLAELEEALEAGAAHVLLDNMGPEELSAAVEQARGRATLEASGGVTLETVRTVAETGVDFISIGALTHSAPALDLSLLLDPL